jgi:VanZ family protein
MLKSLPGKIWLRWLLVALWMGLIFGFSSQAHSGEMTEQYLHGWNIFVRKAAHMTEYGVLFCLVRFALAASLPATGRLVASLSLVICLAYASSDEWHQSFVPGRSAQVSDVMVDMVGVLIALLLCRYLGGLRSFWSRILS